MLNRRHVLASAAATMALAPLGVRAQNPTLSGGPAEQQLKAVLDDLFVQALNDSPELSTSLGLDAGGKPPKFKLSKDSLAELARSKAQTASNLARMRAIDRKALTGMAAVDYDCVLYGLEQTARAGARFN